MVADRFGLASATLPLLAPGWSSGVAAAYHRALDTQRMLRLATGSEVDRSLFILTTYQGDPVAVKRSLRSRLWRDYPVLLLAVPGMLVLLAFQYYPLWGNVIA